MEETNWIALLVAAASALGVGFVWYNPKVFGNAWMASIGMTEEKAGQGNMPLIFGLSFVFAFILAMFLASSVTQGHTPGEYATFKHGAFHGLLSSIFVALPILATNALFEQRSWKYIGINVGYWTVCMMIMGGIISVWP